MAPSKMSARSVPVVAIAFVALAACTSPSPNPKPKDGGTGPTASISVAPGTTAYRYVNEGLTATMLLEGRTGTLEIDNKTGHEVGKPAFYVLNAVDGQRVDGSVSGAVPLPSGKDQTFDVSLGNVEIKDIGLLVLVLGRDNYGAFVEQPSG
jgi:hypothetical protein